MPLPFPASHSLLIFTSLNQRRLRKLLDRRLPDDPSATGTQPVPGRPRRCGLVPRGHRPRFSCIHVCGQVQRWWTAEGRTGKKWECRGEGTRPSVVGRRSGDERVVGIVVERGALYFIQTQDTGE